MLKRYKFFVFTILITLLLLALNKETGILAIETTLFSFKEMILILPPIFILLGLLDVWVSRETMIKYMGEDSGIKGIMLAIVIGSAAAGPLYAAFPIAAVLMKKRAKFTNILIFLGAWSTTKIPMLLFEFSSLGIKFAATRLIVDIFGIFSIAFIVNKLINREELEEIYVNADSIE